MKRLLEVLCEIDPDNGWMDVKRHDYGTECYITALGFEGSSDNFSEAASMLADELERAGKSTPDLRESLRLVGGAAQAFVYNEALSDVRNALVDAGRLNDDLAMGVLDRLRKLTETPKPW